MEENGYITNVEQPTEWVSSMAAVARGGKIGICIDPSNLNKVIKRKLCPPCQVPKYSPSWMQNLDSSR